MKNLAEALELQNVYNKAKTSNLNTQLNDDKNKPKMIKNGSRSSFVFSNNNNNNNNISVVPSTSKDATDRIVRNQNEPAKVKEVVHSLEQ